MLRPLHVEHGEWLPEMEDAMTTEIRPTARATFPERLADLAWAQAYCAARDAGRADDAAERLATRAVENATAAAMFAWLEVQP